MAFTKVLPFLQAEEKELFRTYVEDFNTSTLPHRKFYNLEFYHQEKAARARKKGQSVVCAQPIAPILV